MRLVVVECCYREVTDMKWSDMSAAGKVLCALMFVALLGGLVLTVLGFMGQLHNGTRYGALLFCYAEVYAALVFFKQDKNMKSILLTLAVITFVINAVMLFV